MNVIIKPDYKSIYPSEIREVVLQYVNSTVHPVTNTWYFLLKAPNGEFYSVERRHLTEHTKLGEILK